MRTIGLVLAVLAAGATFAAESQLAQIMAAREQKLEQASAAFEKAKAQADAEAIRQLKPLIASRTRNGDLDGAMAAKKALEKIQGGAASESETVAAPQPKGTGHFARTAKPAGDDEIRRQIHSRAIGLFGSLLAGDTDKAAAYVDPKWSEVVAPAAVKGVLGLISGALRLQQVNTTADIRVERITIGMKRNEAKVEYAVRVGGKWQLAKPAYWILRDGVWYMGEEKHLSNFK